MTLIKDENESYMHVAAKAVLTKWLRDAQEKAGPWDDSPFGFRPNREGPSWGVYMEYPFTEKYGFNPVWDELGYLLGKKHPAYGAWFLEHEARNNAVRAGESGDRWDTLPEAPVSDHQVEIASRWRISPPSVRELSELGLQTLAVADVVVQHKGWADGIFEIQHKNPVSKKKIDFYKSLGGQCVVWELPAAWVLGQVKPPSRIPPEFRLVNNRW